MRRVLFLAGLVCLAVSPAMAQDPAKVDPKHCKVEFENDQVRVLRWKEGPHEKVPMHEHPAYVAISLTDGHARYTLPDGKTREAQRKAGEVIWNAGEKHASENLSDKATELIQVELKGKPPAAKPPVAQDPAKVDPKHHKVESENDQVRVLRMHVGSKETSPMHEHPPSVAVWLTEARNKVTLADGKTEERPHKAGSVGYRQAEKHTVEDLTGKGFEAIIVELKGKPAAAKPAAKKKA